MHALPVEQGIFDPGQKTYSGYDLFEQPHHSRGPARLGLAA